MESKLEHKTIVGIDASRSNVKQLTGTEYYSLEIIKEITKIDQFNFRLYSKTPIEYIDYKKSANVTNKVMRFPRLWSQIRLSFELFRNPPDVTFFPAHTIPFYHGRKTVVTLHDVGFRHFPELYTPLERIYHNYSMGFSVKHATRIITISEATKKDLIKIYKADPKKITIIYHGFDKIKYRPLNSTDKTPDYIKKLGKYIYFIGRLEAKKNIVNLIKAYGDFRKNSNVKLKLVLAGRPGYLYQDIVAEIDKCDPTIRKDIIELGYVDDEKVTMLMRMATIFVFPSKFEGFGMPLVEAMASGVPIVASNTTSIPEIVDNCALLSDPDDFRSIAKNIKTIAENSSVAKDCSEKGLNRAKLFDWEQCARKTMNVVKEAAQISTE